MHLSLSTTGGIASVLNVLSSAFLCDSPIISFTSLYPCSSKKAFNSFAIFPYIPGPFKIASVQTSTADAPAINISAASLPQVTPPTPIIGILTTLDASYIFLTAKGLIGAPDNHPYPF